MIVELRDNFTLLESRPRKLIAQRSDPQLVQDAVSALVNLGYRKVEVEKNVRYDPDGQTDFEEVIKDVFGG